MRKVPSSSSSNAWRNCSWYSSRSVRTRLRAHPTVCRRQEGIECHPGQPALPPHRPCQKQPANDCRQQTAVQYQAMRLPRSAQQADRRHYRIFLSRRRHKQKRGGWSDRQGLSLAGGDGDVKIDGVRGYTIYRTLLSPEASADDANMSSVIVVISGISTAFTS